MLNRLVLRDLNNYTNVPTFSLFTKDDIARYLTNPYRYEKQLRMAVKYIYNASSHFRRLIQYFVGLTLWAYVVEPYRIDPARANVRITNNNYRRVLGLLSTMKIDSQFADVLTVCLREDVYYGTLWVTGDDVTLMQLPSDYCRVATIEGGVANVCFDFSYFDSRLALLENYPAEFRRKYNTYKNNRRLRWIDLDPPNSFAVKCNRDIMDYASTAALFSSAAITAR